MSTSNAEDQRPSDLRWFWRAEPRTSAAVRLICFPHAGASAPSFKGWAAHFGERIELCALQLPGRGYRARETPVRTLQEVIRAAIIELDSLPSKPTVVFGHSDGALFAFEFARALQIRGRPPAHVILSAREAPQVSSRRKCLHEATDERLVGWLKKAGGTPAEILDDAEFMAILLPSFRQDLGLSETHTAKVEPQLSCPVTLLHGTYDRDVRKEDILAWQSWLGPFQLVEVPGGHFFHLTHESEVLSIVLTIIESVFAASGNSSEATTACSARSTE